MICDGVVVQNCKQFPSKLLTLSFLDNTKGGPLSKLAIVDGDISIYKPALAVTLVGENGVFKLRKAEKEKMF